MIRDIDIFNKIKDHLLTQNEKSLTLHEGCAYRGVKQSDLNEAWYKTYKTACPVEIGKGTDNSEIIQQIEDIYTEVPSNLKCAVGAIISDEFYSYDMEENSINSNLVSFPVKMSNPDWKITCQSWAMLEELQALHDGTLVEDWAENLARFSFDSLGNFIDVNE